MKTYPHHLHLGREKNAFECNEVFVEDVLDEMKKIMLFVVKHIMILEI